jgi:hypothetical protein
MNPTLRRIAVSGSAAVALLGGAAAITLADSPSASAAEQTTVHRAVTAPVQMPDGRTIRITGMGGYGHQASDVHVATVAAFKTDTTPAADPTLGTGLTPDGGAGAAITNPVTGTQTGYNQQVTTQASGAGVATGVVAILVLGIIVFFKVKHGHVKVGDAVVVGLFGIAISGTVIGGMGGSLTNSLVGSMGSMLSGLG